MGIDKVGIDKVGIDEVGINPALAPPPPWTQFKGPTFYSDSLPG